MSRVPAQRRRDSTSPSRAAGSLHEDLSRDQVLQSASDRAFGFVMACALTVIAGLPLFIGGAPRLWAAGVAIAFLAASVVIPGALHPLNMAWGVFGRLLQVIVNEVVLGLLFLMGVTPTGIVMRLFGRDLLGRARQPYSPSYWKRRNYVSRGDSLRRQF